MKHNTRDSNAREIIATLRTVPRATVHDMGDVGGGFPDIIVGYNGLNWLMEIKRPGEDLRENQQAWFDRWEGQKCVVRTPNDALRVIGYLR